MGGNGGKENGSMAPMPLGGPGKEYMTDRMPAAPTHQIPGRRQEGRGYDRYPPHDYQPVQHPEAAPAMSAW
jgi:hypothetical protein